MRSQTTLNIDKGELIKKEIKEAIIRLKNNKAVGMGDIPADLIKVNLEKNFKNKFIKLYELLNTTEKVSNSNIFFFI